jgi:6,7-dimethyl-8-ribityllumazine synthase
LSKGHKVAYVQAGWHAEITDRCKEAFAAEMLRAEWDDSEIDYFSVPGSLELPLMAKKLAQSGDYAAVCLSGLVVDGGIYRHEFVAQAVLSGIVQVGLETGVPVLSAVLTPQQSIHEDEAQTRFFRDHMLVKGKELAEACTSIVQAMAALSTRG